MLGLMNSCAAISRFVCPCAGEARDLRLLRGELVERVRRCVCGHARRSPPARRARARRTPPCRSRRRGRGRSAARRARRRVGVRVSATRRRGGGRGRDRRAIRVSAESVDRLDVELLGVADRRPGAPRERAAIPSAQSVPLAPVISARRGWASAASSGVPARTAASISSTMPQFEVAEVVRMLGDPKRRRAGLARSGRGRCRAPPGPSRAPRARFPRRAASPPRGCCR